MRAPFLLPALVLTLSAQTPAPADRAAVVEGLGKELRAKYVFPEVAERVAKALKEKQAMGGYDQAAAPQAFGEALTKDLHALGKDLHFRVVFDPGFKPEANSDKPTKEELAAERQEIASYAFGIDRVERLRGNVGYLEIRGFGRPELVGPAFSAAMTILSGTDALILDLRRNGGGDPGAVAYLLSHFFEEGDARLLNSIYTRPDDTTRQYWINPMVAPRYTRPVYVLTSGRTFSGGEECAYDFQTQKRATLVGETTGGGANPGDMFPLGHGFAAFIPTGRAINPVTSTNWEGVGVKPDIAVPAAEALKTAHVEALKGLLTQAKEGEQRQRLEEILGKVAKGEADVPRYSRP